MALAQLLDRGVVEVRGDEARTFLDRLVTCDLDRVGVGQARFGALLSPQGKILCDFVVIQADASGALFFLDCPASCTSDLVRRLTLYRLRAKVSATDVSATHRVLAGWDGEPMPADPLAIPDPRLPALGWRAVEASAAVDRTPSEAAALAYHAHRIRLGVPEAGRDFVLGDAFPHEALMDQVAGVDFDKGCYVGQEVVSRMQHRGTARTRVVAVTWQEGSPVPGGEILAGERSLGTMGSVAGERGLALMRIDRAADALAAATPIRAGETELAFAKPDWVRFAYPADAMAAAE